MIGLQNEIQAGQQMPSNSACMPALTFAVLPAGADVASAAVALAAGADEVAALRPRFLGGAPSGASPSSSLGALAAPALTGAAACASASRSACKHPICK